MRKLTSILILALIIVLLSACSKTAPEPTLLPDPTFTPTIVVTNTATVEPTPTATAEPPTATPVPPEPTATLVPEPTATPEPVVEDSVVTWGIPIVNIQPTSTPMAAEGQVRVRDLPIGDPGEYINVTLGYWAHYPPTWYTGFGRRPLLVSFSNLDPGTHNRESMRVQGCLIELNATNNIFGFTVDSLLAQLPLSFPDAQTMTLDGRPAVLVARSNEENTYNSEWLYVEAGDQLLTMTFEYARDFKDECKPVWDDMLATWRWFEPDVIDYRNTTYGYAVSHPRLWSRFNEREAGITLSNADPTQSEFVSDLLTDGIVIHTTVLENPDNLPLKQWVAENEGAVEQSNDIPLGAILGVRVIRNDPSGELQEMSGYFQGPLGKIYIVNAIYPVARQWDLRPVANAVIYSFSF